MSLDTGEKDPQIAQAVTAFGVNVPPSFEEAVLATLEQIVSALRVIQGLLDG